MATPSTFVLNGYTYRSFGTHPRPEYAVFVSGNDPEAVSYTHLGFSFFFALRCCFSARVQSAVFAPPAAVVAAFVPGVCLPAVRLCVRAFRLSFAFFHLTFASQNSFHLSLMPRRAPHFLFGKKMGEKNREGSGAPRRSPSNPSDGALRPVTPFFSLLAGLVRPFGPQTAG